MQTTAAVSSGVLFYNKTVSAEELKPLSKFGLIADIQTADVDDAWNFSKTASRSYRGALQALGRAVDSWHSSGVDFVVNLGDIIDQVNETNGDSRRILALVLQHFSRLDVPVWHLVGNHELYNFTRDELLDLIPGIANNGCMYHDFTPAKGWRAVVLDSYDVHCINNKEASEFTETAFQMLEEHNPNNVRAERGTTNWSAGMSGLDARWVPFNGAVGEIQAKWLKNVVRDSVEKGEKLIVFSHVPLLPGCAARATLLWNYSEILEILDGGNTIAVFAGHDHKGGHAVSPTGTHHVTIPSPLNITGSLDTAHATVELYENSLRLTGSACVPSYELNFTNKASKL
eukprot:TRINITY_DN8320_c0_g1_i1.p1 TRINITY_DN8320_c0_g1~~TRINITY_DN8320_c0_g1_i1.p1  ORF type:complete len:356 (+),score=88.01 TRINITY_DN8320_c0_g1_i1:42-1070(+)